MSKKEIEAFLNELSEVRAELAENSDRKFVVRDTLKAEFDTLYKDYIVEGYTSGIEGNYGVNTAVRVVVADRHFGSPATSRSISSTS